MCVCVLFDKTSALRIGLVLVFSHVTITNCTSGSLVSTTGIGLQEYGTGHRTVQAYHPYSITCCSYGLNEAEALGSSSLQTWRGMSTLLTCNS
jgi:hypothetical protein